MFQNPLFASRFPHPGFRICAVPASAFHGGRAQRPQSKVPPGHRRLARGNAPGNSSKLSHASRKGRRNRGRNPQLGLGEESLAKGALAARSAPQRAVTAEPTPAVGKRSAARRVFAETGPHGVFKPARKPRSGRDVHRASFISRPQPNDCKCGPSRLWRSCSTGNAPINEKARYYWPTPPRHPL